MLALTNNGWLVASETEQGGATVEKSDFSDTLFLELASVLLLGQLRIAFAAAGQVALRNDQVRVSLGRVLP